MLPYLQVATPILPYNDMTYNDWHTCMLYCFSHMTLNFKSSCTKRPFPSPAQARTCVHASTHTIKTHLKQHRSCCIDASWCVVPPCIRALRCTCHKRCLTRHHEFDRHLHAKRHLAHAGVKLDVLATSCHQRVWGREREDRVEIYTHALKQRATTKAWQAKQCSFDFASCPTHTASCHTHTV